MNFETPGLAAFVERQMRDFGGNTEIDSGLWGLFGAEATDDESNALARALLAEATFSYDCGSSEDERWTLYYVDAANRSEAMSWLDDCHNQLSGAVRLPTPAQRRQIDELAESPMPHRVAQKL